MRSRLDANSNSNEKEETSSAVECALDPYDQLCAQQRTASEAEELRHDEMFAGATCNRPECPYRDAGKAPALRDGERIDYVLYRANAGAPPPPPLSLPLPPSLPVISFLRLALLFLRVISCVFRTQVDDLR